MGKLILTLTVMLVGLQVTYAKAFGNFSSYQQITDKEILFVTTNGYRILVTANQDCVIGIKALGEQEKIKLKSTSELKQMGLSGSLYVEELDDQIEISSASSSSIKIRVNKAPFRFTYLNSKNNQVIVDEFKCPQFDKNSCNISFLLGSNEQIEVYAGDKQTTAPALIDVVPNQINQFAKEPMMIVSSNGYAILLDSSAEKQFQKTKRNQLNIKVMNASSELLQYYLVIGNTSDDLFARVAQLNKKFEHMQLTQK